MKFCRNVCNNGSIYKEQEQQLWLIYVLNYLPYKYSYPYLMPQPFYIFLTKHNDGVYNAKGIHYDQEW